MEFSHDELRRQLADTERAQADALPGWREVLARVFSDRPDPLIAASGRQKAKVDLTVGALTRRRLFRLGGLSVASTAVLAACVNRGVTGKGPDQIPIAGSVTPTTALPPQDINDITLLRTASSLEHVAIDVYDLAIESGLVTDAAVADAAKRFRDHHRQHALQFESATRSLGGQAFKSANPVVWKGLVEPAIESLTDQAAVVAFAHELEGIAAATYQAVVPVLTTPQLRRAAMSVGAVEARHAAVLAALLPGSAPVAGLDTIAPETTTTTGDGAPEEAAPVFQVPGPFGSVAAALGPNSFAYAWLNEDGTVNTRVLGG